MYEALALGFSGGALLFAILTFVRNGKKGAKEEEKDISTIRESGANAKTKLDLVYDMVLEIRGDVRNLNREVAEIKAKYSSIDKDIARAFQEIAEIRNEVSKIKEKI